jgi:hypothetical protein
LASGHASSTTTEGVPKTKVITSLCHFIMSWICADGVNGVYMHLLSSSLSSPYLRSVTFSFSTKHMTFCLPQLLKMS